MKRLISRTSNKIGVFYRRRRLRTMQGNTIRNLMIMLLLTASLTLIGCDSRKPAPVVTATTEKSPTPNVTRTGPQGGSPIPCQGGAPAGALGPCSSDAEIMQVCGNCEADSGYPTSANRYGWWCADNLDEAANKLGFTKNCKVTRVISQQECCNRAW